MPWYVQIAITGAAIVLAFDHLRERVKELELQNDALRTAVGDVWKNLNDRVNKLEGDGDG